MKKVIFTRPTPFIWQLLLLSCLFFTTQIAQAQTTWEGDDGVAPTDWDVAENWDTGAVPMDMDDVIIPSTANQPMITSLTNAEAKSVTINAGAMLTIQNMGMLTIDGSTSDAILNRGIVENSGKIIIGLNIKIGSATAHNGIENRNMFTNKMGGKIQIEETGGHGVNNSTVGIFSNKGLLKIGVNKKTDAIGIDNHGSFTNESTGDIIIDETRLNGIVNRTNTFTNHGKMTIGAGKKTGSNGIANFGTFINAMNGEINIDETGFNGIRNPVGMFTNHATINIGRNKKMDWNGIENRAIFNNEMNGEINIDETGRAGISNFLGAFTNRAKINIGVHKKTALYGIQNTNATFTNEMNGEINIDETGSNGILNTSGFFTNYAKISIGRNKKTGHSGINNRASFTNEVNGEITIDETGDLALLNIATFTNHAKITIGAHKKATNAIQNAANFTNEINGNITIEETSGSGISNGFGLIGVNAVFTNRAIINIGVHKKTGQDGIQNFTKFNNEMNGEINIDETGRNGIWNLSGKFTNHAKVNIGIHKKPSEEGIKNGGNFTNLACAELHLFDNLLNSGSVLNDGWVQLNTLETHTPGNFTNNGIVEDIHDTFPTGGGFQNNDLLIAPVSDWECLVTNALGVGNMNSFSIGSQWFMNADLSGVAGNYDAFLNEFMPTNIGAGAHTLYLNIMDNVNGCSRTVSIKVLLNADIEKPNFNGTCASYPMPFGTDIDECFATINFNIPTPTDNCSIAELKAKIWDSNGNVFQNWTTNPDGQFPPDTYDIRWRAKDPSGNQKACTKSFTVMDDEAPDAECHPTVTLQLVNGQATLTVADVDNGSDDNCGIVNHALSQVIFDCDNRGTQMATLTVTDAAGLTDFCETQVIVNGTSVEIGEVSKLEGTGNGFNFYLFPVTRATNDCTFTVDYSSADGTATVANNDYQHINGAMYFPAGGSFQQYAIVRVVRDSDFESDENFFVNLISASAGVNIPNGQAEGEILNDDIAPLMGDPNHPEIIVPQNLTFVQERQLAGDVVLYPNPTGQGQFLNVSAPPEWFVEKSVEVVLYDRWAREVGQFELGYHTAGIEVSALPEGLYFLMFRLEGGQVLTKGFVKGSEE